MRKQLGKAIDGFLRVISAVRLGADFEPLWPKPPVITGGLSAAEVGLLYGELSAVAKDCQQDIELNHEARFNVGYRDAALTFMERLLELANTSVIDLDIPEWALGGANARAGDKGLQADDFAGSAA